MKTSFLKRYRHVVFLTVLILACVSVIFAMSTPVRKPVKHESPAPVVVVDPYVALYDSLHLDSMELSRSAYTTAIQGYKRLLAAGELVNANVLSIIDFTLASSKKRLFVIDMITGKVLFNTYVAHGRNSGKEIATHFSNKMNSFMSSLGFYLTGDTYKGKHGFSLKLNGLEKGINDNALARNIVIHGSNYVNEKFATARGYVGRSLGCPAIPQALHKDIIGAIQNGTCLFLYGQDQDYTTHSSFLQKDSATVI